MHVVLSLSVLLNRSVSVFHVRCGLSFNACSKTTVLLYALCAGRCSRFHMFSKVDRICCFAQGGVVIVYVVFVCFEVVLLLRWPKCSSQCVFVNLEVSFFV